MERWCGLYYRAGRDGRSVCHMYLSLFSLIPSLTGHGFLLGEEVGGGGDRWGMSRGGVWYGSDLTSMHVKMYWLSPLVGLRLIC